MADARARTETDVAVVGLGAMGSATLWALARRGVRAIGVEQFTPGHDRGSSHGESRIIRTAYFEGPGYVPLARRAWKLWRELEAATGAPLLTPTGGLTVGRPDGALVRGVLAAAETHDLPVERLDTARLRDRAPCHLLGEDMVGVLEREAGVLRPEAGVRAAVAAAAAAGATVADRERVRRIVPDPDHPTVLTADREIVARHVVVAAGAWVPRLLPALAGDVSVIRKVVGWFAASDPTAYDPGRFPVFLRDDGDGSMWYGFPTLDGRTVKVAEHAGGDPAEAADPEAGARLPDDGDARTLGRLAARLRGLGTAPERTSVCMYSMTPDEHFVVGAAPGAPGVTVLGGFSGHGYKFAPVIGEAAAGLAVDGGTELPIEAFDPGRLAAAAARH